MELLHSSALFLLTNFLFGAIVASFLLAHNDRLRLPQWPLILTGFALGPYLTTMVLYYALALWHGIPALVLVALPMLVFAVLAYFARPGMPLFWNALRGIPTVLRDRSLWFFLGGTALMLFVSLIFLINKPLVDHDVLEYAVQGRIFLRNMAIVYQQHHFDAASGFYYVGLHGFSFPLLFTWEGLTGGMFNLQGDLWARSLTPWYAWLLVTFVWSVLRRVDRWLAVAGGIALTVPVGFLYLVTIYHVDSFRILFFSMALAAFVVLLQTPSRERLLLFSVICGAQAFIHSVGAILAGLMLLVLLFFLPYSMGVRARWAALSAAVMLAMGGIHYVADVLFGTGWIFQDLIWY